MPHHYNHFLPAFRRLLIPILIALLLLSTVPTFGQTAQSVEIAAALSLTGDGNSFGQPTLEGIQLALEEANAAGDGTRITLKTYDDKSSDDEAAKIATQIASSPAQLVIGPSFSTASLAAGPAYAAASLVSLPATATSDLITQNATTFRIVFKNSDQGETLATYLARVLGQRRAAVFVVDSGYGTTLRQGFERTAAQLKIEATYHLFKPDDDAEALVRSLTPDEIKSPVIFLTLDPEGAKLLTALRRLGATGPFLGGDAFGDESFSQRMKDLPEDKAKPGFFTDNLYGLAPVILDSANAETLLFAERYRVRYGHDPVWMSVAGYDATRLAAIAIRATAASNTEVKAQRTAILGYLTSLNSLLNAQPGILGPFWFDNAHARQQAIRVGHFHSNRFESAPVQIVPVALPDAKEVESGAVFALGQDRYARLQRVVYTGVFVNEISRVDLSRSSFNADFYIWLRSAKEAGPDAADPTELIFPNMVSGSFDRTKPAEQRETPDDARYWLWRVQGEFRNDFDLHRYPFDRQTLAISIANARAPMERIVYVLDKRTVTGKSAGDPAINPLSIASPNAFRNLTQWDALDAHSRRENLVTDSPLGDPSRVGAESQRELSGFLVTVDIQRRALSTVIKTLLPLLLLALIMFASLFFPAALVKEKVSVAVTGALSGAVLLTSINTQLGGVGYTIAVEYMFYIFFALSLLCIVAVLSAERLRTANRLSTALTIENGTRLLFFVAIAGTVVGALLLARQ